MADGLRAFLCLYSRPGCHKKGHGNPVFPSPAYGGELFGISDPVLLYYFPFFCGRVFLSMETVDGQEAVELHQVRNGLRYFPAACGV